ncbi:hypothetical protein AC1031_007923 [Aphanomyces cochlioides]|nr:hypothetical protein AC1031_007923 [Aphanomyces cochlioides]
MSSVDALTYDPEDLEELLNFSGSDSESEPPSTGTLPPLMFVDLPPRPTAASSTSKKAQQLEKFGVFHSPFGPLPKAVSPPSKRLNPVLSPNLPYVKKKPPTRLAQVTETSPSKMAFKTNDIIKHGELKVYMCRYTTIQPLFCIPFHETTTLAACRKRIDDLLMVELVDYVFVAPTGKTVATAAEARFLAYWFHPVLTILVTSINQQSSHPSPEKLLQALHPDFSSKSVAERPWNLSYASFGMFSSKELRMQSAIIQAPMGKKIRQRQQRDALRLALETPDDLACGAFEAPEKSSPALDRSTVQTILQRSHRDVLQHISEREYEKRKFRHAKIQQRALALALDRHDKATKIQAWWRMLLGLKCLQAKKQAAICIQNLMRQRSVQRRQERARRNCISLQKTAKMTSTASQYVYQAVDRKGVVKLQAIQRRRLVQKALREHPEKAQKYLELERRREMVRQSQENFEKQKALAQLRKLHAVERKQRKELNKLAFAARQHAAAVVIQSSYRRHRAGQFVHFLRRERTAAIKIQSHLRKNSALAKVETLKLQMRKSSLSGSSMEYAESYHPRLFCRRVWFRGSYHLLYSCVSKAHFLLVLHANGAGKQSDPIAVECVLDMNDLKTFGLLPSTTSVRIHDVDRLVEGATAALTLSKGQYLLNQQDFHKFRNISMNSRTLLLPNPDMYFGRMYQRCSDSNPPHERLRCFLYSAPTLIYYVAKRMKLGMAHLGFFEDRGVLYVECYISRWHICICVGLQYQEWAFSGLGVLSACDLGQKIDISKHIAPRISIGHLGVRIDVRKRLFHLAKRFRVVENDATTYATALFSVYILGQEMQLEVVFPDGWTLQCGVEAPLLRQLGYKDVHQLDMDTISILSRQMLTGLAIVDRKLCLHL